MVNAPKHIFATTTTALKMPEKPEMEKTDALKDNPTEKPLSKAGPQPLNEKPERGATRGGVKFIALAMLLVVPCAYFCASQHAATISTDTKMAHQISSYSQEDEVTITELADSTLKKDTTTAGEQREDDD